MNANGDVAFFGGENASKLPRDLGRSGRQGARPGSDGEAIAPPGTTGTFRDLSEILTFDSSLAIGSAGHVAFRGAFLATARKEQSGSLTPQARLK